MSHLHKGRGVSGKEFQKIRSGRILELRSTKEARRQQDLQRIRDMKSKTGIHPLERFPKEIWEKIYEFLNPKDLGAILEVHELFHLQLSKRRIGDILLPQILNLKFTPSWNPELDTQDENYYNGNDGYANEAYGELDEEWEQDMPLSEVNMGEFVQLRLVSKSLRNNIDQLFKNMIIRCLRSEKQCKVNALFLPFPGQEEDKQKFGRGNPYHFRDNRKNLDGMLESFRVGSNCAKRFFVRSLKVEISNYDDNIRNLAELEQNFLEAFGQFKFKITSLLETIGEQIWRFELVFRSSKGRRAVSVSQIYVALKEWAELMPNLKWLVLENGHSFGYKEAKKVLKNVSENFPFPRLEHLVRICCDFNSQDYNNNTFDIFSKVLTANPHVKALNVNLGKGNESFFKECLNPLLASIPLDLDLFFMKNPSNYLVDYRSMFDFVKPAINPNWQLKRMHLDLGCDARKSTLKSVFELLGKFPTLEYLTLNLTNVSFEFDIPFLKLPNLIYLKMKLHYDCDDQHVMEYTPATNFFFSLQFLLYAKKLKNLKWRLEGWHTSIWKLRRFLVNHESNEQCVNFRAGMRDLRSSNLWDIFPFLEKVKMEFQKSYEFCEEHDEFECQRLKKF